MSVISIEYPSLSCIEEPRPISSSDTSSSGRCITIAGETVVDRGKGMADPSRGDSAWDRGRAIDLLL